jgi:hypothetical protein
VGSCRWEEWRLGRGGEGKAEGVEGCRLEWHGSDGVLSYPLGGMVGKYVRDNFLLDSAKLMCETRFELHTRVG